MQNNQLTELELEALLQEIEEEEQQALYEDMEKTLAAEEQCGCCRRLGHCDEVSLNDGACAHFIEGYRREF